MTLPFQRAVLVAVEYAGTARNNPGKLAAEEGSLLWDTRKSTMDWRSPLHSQSCRQVGRRDATVPCRYSSMRSPPDEERGGKALGGVNRSGQSPYAILPLFIYYGDQF